MTTVMTLTAIPAVVVVGFACFSPPNIVWRNTPFARGWRYQEILNDKSLINASRATIQTKLGLPDQVSGPYSWWSLLDMPSDGELSALSFHYDEHHNITRIELRETTLQETTATTLPLDLEEYQNKAPEIRHRIHLELAELSKQGNLPNELVTIEDVERYFPKARFVENWYYYIGVSKGSIVVGFDKDGNVKDIWNDW